VAQASSLWGGAGSGECGGEKGGKNEMNFALPGAGLKGLGEKGEVARWGQADAHPHALSF